MDVSIIITSYNYSQYIEECINSCLSQDDTKIKYEVIIIDDGSTDETPKILSKFKNKILRKYRIKNSGIEIASNFALSKAKGKFIVRVDADDKLATSYLHYVEKNLSSSFDFYYSDYGVIDSNMKITSLMNLPEFNVNEILKRGDFLATGTLYSAKLLRGYGYYREGIKNSGLENYELILRLLKDQKIGKHIPHYLFYYRRHDSNISIKKNHQITKNGIALFKKFDLGDFTTNKYHPYNPPEA